MGHLHHLLSPLRIKGLNLPNRVVMAPMGTRLAEPEGRVSPAQLAYYQRRARSGAGLIIGETVAVHPAGHVKGQPGAYDDSHLSGLAKLAQAMRSGGGLAAMQVNHAGRENLALLKLGEAVGPSATPSPLWGLKPRPMSRDDLAETVAAYAAATSRLKEAGFDLVEIHAAHGYLLSQFLSPLDNLREDDYGGDMTGRARLIVEVIAAARAQVGPGFPLSLRLSAEELRQGGYALADLLPLLPRFVAAGVDLIHVSVATFGTPGRPFTAPAEYEPGFNAPRAAQVRAAVDAPVIAVGRFRFPEEAERVLRHGQADLVAFGRQFLADPDFLAKGRAGREGEIRPCLACNACLGEILSGRPIRCAINPETGRELEYPRGPAPVSRRVGVVGAGPAGLTAALEAARLGHQVTLWEGRAQAGGQVRLAARPPFKNDLGHWADWLEARVREAGVTILTGRQVTPGELAEARPEAVILASGAEALVPAIPGLDLPHVCLASQVLGGERPPQPATVIIGGGLVGLETADFLLVRGSRVTVVEMLPASPVSAETAPGYQLHRRLEAGGCRLWLGTRVVEILPRAVRVESQGRESVISPVDQVVLAAGFKAHAPLRDFLSAAGIPHLVVGDAQEPRSILAATREGAEAAWQL